MSSQAQTYLAAQQSFAAGNYDDALTEAKQVIEKSGEDTCLLLLAGDIHSTIAAQDSFQSEDVREAARYYKHVVSLTNENSEAHLDATYLLAIIYQKVVSKILDEENLAEAPKKKALSYLESARNQLQN